MYTKTTFETDIGKLWPQITKETPGFYKPERQKVEIDDAWQMFENAKGSNLSELLLGDVKLRSQIEILKNFGTTSGTETTMERRTLNAPGGGKILPGQVTSSQRDLLGDTYRREHGTAHIRKGSVLNDAWWWPFKNDAWVIGGVQGLKRFHLTMASVPDDLLWDAKAKRPRVLGRELIGLHAAGYALIGVPSWAIQSPTRTEVKKAPEPGKVAVTSTPVGAAKVRETIGMVFAPQSANTATTFTFELYRTALAKVKSVNDIKAGILSNEVAFDTYDFAKI